MAEFQWRFQRRSGSASLRGTLEVQQSTGKRTAVVQDITGFYVDGAMLLDELIIAYHEPLSEKSLVIRVMSNTNEPGFQGLVEALAAARPSADLRALPRKEALKKLGVVDARRLAMLIAPTLMFATAFLVSVPALRHGLDHGEDRVSVAELGTRPLTSNNLVLTGELDTANYTWETKTTNGVKTTTRAWFPVRAPGAPPDAPVPIMLKTKGGKDALPAGNEWRCLFDDSTGRFTDTQRKWFREDKINVTDGTVLCDLSRTPQSEMDAFIGVMTIAFVGALLLGVFLWFNARPRNRPAVKPPLT